jgi:UDP-N-acetylmuramoylalanine--D-glutamate ligase
MDAYIADKRVIYQSQEKEDLLVTENDAWGQSFRSESRARSLIYSDNVLPDGLSGGWIDEGSGCGLVRADGSVCGNSAHRGSAHGDIFEAVPASLLVPGKHQKKNMLAAALALLDLGLPAEFIRENLGKFPGIEHRLEFFHESKGIKFYNDSAATIPEATAMAIRAFDRVPVLVCGGTDKNLDFSPLVEAWAAAMADYTAQAQSHNVTVSHNTTNARILLLEGSGSSKLAAMLDAAGLSYNGPFDSIEEAVEAVLKIAQVGDAVVLSPGCTSFGMFTNEFDRGNKWKEAVRRLA